jgi:hypothetical protein
MSYNTEVIFTPKWASALPNNTNLLLFKLYLSNDFININELIEYLGIPIDIILLLGAQFLPSSNSNKNATNTINSLNLMDINLKNEDEFNFISETLLILIFDQILRVTTIDLWGIHKDKTKQLLAAINLKSKMASIKNINATATTASAIATEIYNDS